MSAIKDLNRDIANLQKVAYYLHQVKGLAVKDKRVYSTALFVRTTFDLFDQRWRDGLKNDFFFFCFPKYAVLDGHIPYNIGPNDTEARQERFESGCLQLHQDVDRLLKKMKDLRGRLLNQQNLGAVNNAFSELDKLLFSIFKIGEEGKQSGSEMEEELSHWDSELQKKLEDLGLSKRFSSIIPDCSNPLKERVQDREQTLAHYMETLANDRKDQGDTHLHISESNIGILNTGTISDIKQIHTSINTLQTDHKEVAEKLACLSKEVESAELPKDTKEQAIEAIQAVSTELAASDEQRRSWRFTKNIKELKDLFIASGTAAEAYKKIHPLLQTAIDAIHKHFPQLPLG